MSHTYVVLRQLGYGDVSFYEGSLTDWLRTEDDNWDPAALQQTVRARAEDGLDRLVTDVGEDVFNHLKLIGLYHQKQAGYFMLRTKIPGGMLDASQARTIADVADEFARAPPEHGGREQNPIFGDGYLDLTTRQDVQMHWIRLEDVPEIWDRYESVGLTTLQACGNSVRNVVSCPAAGIDTNHVIDASGIADEITDRFTGDRRFANLPRKFKISVTGCDENCARAQINDLAFTPAIRDGRDGFEVHVGGGLSDGPRLADPLDIFVDRDQVVPLVEAAAELYLETGSYLDTAVNRFRFLVEELGPKTVRGELADRVPFELVTPDESLTTKNRGDHVGVHEQEDGRQYVGLNVPTGRMSAKAFGRIADLARTFGADELRVTLNQNLLIPHVTTDDLPSLLDDPLVDQYPPDPGPFSRGIVACTGSEFCTYGIVETKARAIRWARELDDWAETAFDEPPPVVRMHLSGCSASCAQPQVADIGLRGETVRDPHQGVREAVDIGLGGDLAVPTLIDWVAGKVPMDQVEPTVQRLVTAYIESSSSETSFAEWLNDRSTAALRGFVSEPVEVN